MKPYQRLLIIFSLFVVTTILCGCPPLPYKLFVRNTTSDTVELSLIIKKPDTNWVTFTYGFSNFPSAKRLKVYSINEVIPIKKNALSKLTDSLIAHNDNGHVRLQIPPKTSVFLNSITNAFYKFSDKSLIIKQATKVDTFRSVYPYRALSKLKNVKSKSDGIRFYRTAIWFDIN